MPTLQFKVTYQGPERLVVLGDDVKDAEVIFKPSSTLKQSESPPKVLRLRLNLPDESPKSSKKTVIAISNVDDMAKELDQNDSAQNEALTQSRKLNATLKTSMAECGARVEQVLLENRLLREEKANLHADHNRALAQVKSLQRKVLTCQENEKALCRVLVKRDAEFQAKIEELQASLAVEQCRSKKLLESHTAELAQRVHQAKCEARAEERAVSRERHFDEPSKLREQQTQQ